MRFTAVATQLLFALWIVILACVAHAQAQNPVSPPPFFPSQPGTRLLYEAHVKYTVPNTNPPEVQERDLELTVEVAGAIQKAGFTLIKFNNFPDDLARFYLSAHFDTYILQIGNAVYKFTDYDAPKLWAAAQKAGSAHQLEPAINKDKLWFELPLRDGAGYCPPGSKREGRMYCWSVEGTEPVKQFPGGSAGSNQVAFRLIYRSNPAHEIYTLSSGLGVVYYQYVHHGTVMEAEATLKDIRAPGK